MILGKPRGLWVILARGDWDREIVVPEEEMPPHRGARGNGRQYAHSVTIIKVCCNVVVAELTGFAPHV